MLEFKAVRLPPDVFIAILLVVFSHGKLAPVGPVSVSLDCVKNTATKVTVPVGSSRRDLRSCLLLPVSHSPLGAQSNTSLCSQVDGMSLSRGADEDQRLPTAPLEEHRAHSTLLY